VNFDHSERLEDDRVILLPHLVLNQEAFEPSHACKGEEEAAALGELAASYRKAGLRVLLVSEGEFVDLGAHDLALLIGIGFELIDGGACSIARGYKDRFSGG